MTDQQEKILLHWMEKICRKCEELGISYGILLKTGSSSHWITSIDKFLTRNAYCIKLDELCLSFSDINIVGFHEGPADTPWDSIYEIYWEIPLTALLDPHFHAAFDAEFEYRKFNYLFGRET